MLFKKCLVIAFAFFIVLIAKSQGTATIQFIGAADTVVQMADTVAVVIKVTNTDTAQVIFTVAHDDSASTAVRGYGKDYDFSNATYNNPPGITYDTLHVVIFNNPFVSPTKTAVIRFINVPENGVVVPDSVYTIYITNDNKLSVGFLGAAYSYPNDTPAVQVRLVVSSPMPQPTSVDVSLGAGSAVFGVDFTFNDTTVTFPAYSIDTQAVWVNIISNNIYQHNKQINFNLSNPTNNALLGVSAFTLTIINNDSLAAGINEPGFENGVKIYPNPVSNVLNIEPEQALNGFSITDLTGRLVYDTRSLPSGKNTIPVSSLTPGIYFINAVSGDKIVSRKFLKLAGE